MALGASRGGSVANGVLPTASDGGAGALCCLLLIPVGGTLLQAFLYNVKAFDPLTIAGAPVALLTMALLACLGPARSAWRSNPSTALRED